MLPNSNIGNKIVDLPQSGDSGTVMQVITIRGNILQMDEYQHMCLCIQTVYIVLCSHPYIHPRIMYKHSLCQHPLRLRPHSIALYCFPSCTQQQTKTSSFDFQALTHYICCEDFLDLEIM